MKNIFKSLMLVAVAAMGFACQETMEENYTPTNPREVVMTIIADADEETRTYISDEANGKIAWSEGDQLKVIENSKTYRTTTATTIAADGKAQFAVSFPANTLVSEFTYDAIFPASAVVEDDAEKVNVEKIKVVVKDQQKPTATSFDPQADILVAKQVVVDAQPTELNMQFKRLVAMGKMTLKNLPADAKISQVVFTAGAKDVLAGRNYVNAATGKVSEYGYFGDTNIVTLNYDEAISTRDIYFVCNPFEMAAGETFKVKAVCGDKSYTREVAIPDGRSLAFTEGDMTTFTVNMEDATKESSFVLADGVYAVIANDGSKYYAMQGVSGGKYMNYSEVSYDGKAATFATNDETLGWTIAAVEGGYTFKNYEDKYLLYGTGTANTATLGNAETLTITPIDGTNQYKIAAKETPGRILAFNTNSGQERFAFYTGTQEYKLYLVPVVADTTPRFTVSPNAMQTINADGGTIEFKVDEYNGAEVSAQSSDNSWLTIDNVTFIATVKPNQTATERSAKITFSAEGAESVEVTVTQIKAGILIEEEFDNATNADSSTAITTSKFPNFSGATSKAYTSQYGGLKLGSSSAVGYITSKVLDLSKPFIVEIDACKYGSDGGNIEITVGGVKKSIANNVLGAAGTFKTFTLEFDAATETSTIKIATSSKRAYIDNVNVYYKGPGESGGEEPEAPAEPVQLAPPVVTPSVNANVVTLSWDAVAGAKHYTVQVDDGEEKIVTDTEYVFEGDYGVEYKFTVKAIAADTTKNSDSEAAVVTVTIEEESGGEQEEVTAELKFVAANRTSWNTSQQTWEVEGVKLVNEKGSSTSNVADYVNPARFYKSSKITVTADGNITTIVFDCNSTTYATDLKNSIGSAAKVSSDKVTVTLDGASNTFVVAKLTAQVRIDAVTVTYKN